MLFSICEISLPRPPLPSYKLMGGFLQCVIIATRPLLLSVLKERMEKLIQSEEEWHKFLILPRSLVSIGIKSAVKSLEILYDEKSYSITLSMIFHSIITVGSAIITNILFNYFVQKHFYPSTLNSHFLRPCT